MVRETGAPPIHLYNLPTNSAALRCVYRKSILVSLWPETTATSGMFSPSSKKREMAL